MNTRSLLWVGMLLLSAAPAFASLIADLEPGAPPGSCCRKADDEGRSCWKKREDGSNGWSCCPRGSAPAVAVCRGGDPATDIAGDPIVKTGKVKPAKPTLKKPKPR